MRTARPAWSYACIGVVWAVAVLACETPSAPPAEPPGVTVARSHLYPYRFTAQQTLRGTRVLDDYLQQAPDGRDARMATWLLGRTYLDMLTRVVTLRAEGESHAADELFEVLGEELGGSATEADAARAIRSRLETLGGTDVLGSEAAAAVKVLDAIVGREDPARLGTALAEVAAGDLEVATNARLLIAAQAMSLFAGMGGLSPERMVDYFAARYPFPCPTGLAAYASGDRSLAACGFVCARAEIALESAPVEAHKAILVKECGPKHFGFVDREDALYLSRENYVIVQMLRHMSSVLDRLKRDAETPLRDLHRDFIVRFEAFMSALAIPSLPPLMGPGDQDLHLVSLQAQRPATTGIQQLVAISASGVYLNIPAHFRVERGQVYMPEVILRYSFPGRRAAATEVPFVLAGPEEGNAVEAGLLSLLDDLERDRPRLTGRVGDLVPGAVPTGLLPQEPGRHLAEARRTGLLIDSRTTVSLFAGTLRTLHDQGYHPFELLVWHPRTASVAAVFFETELGPVPLAGEVVWLDESGWLHRARDGRLSRSAAEAASNETLVELYWKAERGGSDHPIYLVPADGLSLTRLATAIEVLNGVRGSESRGGVGQIGLDELLAHQPSDPSAAASPGSPHVVLALSPQARPR